MTYPKQLFKTPGPYGLAPRSYAVAGADDEEQEKALLAKGWHLTLEEARGPARQTSPFDHDGDGKPGGSLPAAQRKPRQKKEACE